MDSLSDNVWKTMKSRFTAAERTKRKHKALVFTISFLSIAQVIVAIGSLCGVDFPCIASSKVEFLTITVSIIILVIANQDSLGVLLNQSASYHRCANRLHEILGRINVELESETVSKEAYLGFTKEYSEVLEFYDLNHDMNDFLKMASERSKVLEMSRFKKFRVCCKYYLSIYGMAFLYCAIPFILSYFVSIHSAG
nr:SLATT domain-containing protein [Desulfovibrio sp. JC022]